MQKHRWKVSMHREVKHIHLKRLQAGLQLYDNWKCRIKKSMMSQIHGEEERGSSEVWVILRKENSSLWYFSQELHRTIMGIWLLANLKAHLRNHREEGVQSTVNQADQTVDLWNTTFEGDWGKRHSLKQQGKWVESYPEAEKTPRDAPLHFCSDKVVPTESSKTALKSGPQRLNLTVNCVRQMGEVTFLTVWVGDYRQEERKG